MRTQKEIREAFWISNPMCLTREEIKSVKRSKKRQNDYPTNIRCAFVDFVDQLQKDGEIPEKIALKVTL